MTNQCNIDDIRVCTKAYADSCKVLSERVSELNNEIEEVKKRHIQALKGAATAVINRKIALKCLIESNKNLFIRPKTRVFNDVKVGYQKAKGKIIIAAETKTIAQIKKLFPESFTAYIKTEEKVIKKALDSLDAKELKQCGISITDDTDIIVIKQTDGDAEQLANTLLEGIETKKS